MFVSHVVKSLMLSQLRLDPVDIRTLHKCPDNADITLVHSKSN